MCSGQSRTRCFALINLVVVEAAVVPDFALDLDPALLVRPPLGAGESVLSPLRPEPFALGAGTAFGSAFLLVFVFFGGSDPARAGAAFGVGIVPSFNGGGVNLSIAVLGKLSLCL